jgi:ABC-type Fe3+/spermidine/putrescine transport system ATPase subunit
MNSLSDRPRLAEVAASPGEMPPPRLRLSGLHKRLGKTQVVDGVDLTIRDGESLVLLGPSGCGKTTTLRMVAGFIAPDEGEIHLSGRLTAGPGVAMPVEQRRLGMVFQSYAVWPHKTVFENVAYGLSVAGVRRAEIRDRVAAALELVQLGALKDRSPGDLSGGQQQRVALARAMVVEPSLLLLDEPLSNLDAGLRQTMRLELKRLHQRTGMTTMYVTHDQEEALVLADRLAVMREGRIEQLDTPEAIYRRPCSRFVAGFVGASNILEAKVVEVDRAGARLLALTGLGAPVWAGAGAGLLANAMVGMAIGVVLRPEAIRLGAVAPEGCVGRLREAAFLGSRYEAVIEAAGRMLTVHSRRLDVPVDGVVGLTLKPGSLWAVP